MSKAQDNVREDLQKQRFELVGDHTRDATFDAFYKMSIEFKTKAKDKGCTTKRRYVNDPLGRCVTVVSNYIDKATLSEEDWIAFPPATAEWRKEQERKLKEDNGTIPCFEEVDEIEKLLGESAKDPKVASILQKFRNQVHRNDPAIPKIFFDSDGEFTSINRKKVKVKHPEWMFRVPTDVDKGTFLREKIDLYMDWLEKTKDNLGNNDG